MLKQRVITALILVALCLAALFFLPLPWFAVAAALLFLISAWEWSNLAALSGIWRPCYVIVVAVLLCATWYWLQFDQRLAVYMQRRATILFVVALVGWSLAILCIVTYPTSAKYWARRSIELLAGIVVLMPCWAALVYLRGQPQGEWLIIILVVSVVCADTGAYFVGRQWGRNKMAPNVSPGKSMEGLYGGLVCSALFAVVLVLSLGASGENWWLLAIVLPTSVISIFGDLLESMLKRQRGIKDSGTILPGHGGILDRIDSITAAAPVFTLALLLTAWRF